MKKTVFAVAFLGLAFGQQVQAEDVAAGEKVFRKCKVCHLVDKERHKTGPHLINLFGRKAGTAEGFSKYSKAMKAKGDEGLVWSEEILLEYLIKPKEYVKGTKMAFGGLKKEKDRINLVGYLVEATKPAE